MSKKEPINTDTYLVFCNVSKDSKETSYDYRIIVSELSLNKTLYTMAYSQSEGLSAHVRGTMLFKATDKDGDIKISLFKKGWDYSTIFALKIFTDFMYKGMSNAKDYTIVRVAEKVKK